MWDRPTLKQRGRTAFLRNYWWCVLVSFILSLLTRGFEVTARTDVEQPAQRLLPAAVNSAYSFLRGFQSGIGGLRGALVLGGGLIGLALSVLIFNLLEVGGRRFYVENSYSPARPNALAYGFTNGNYGHIVVTMALRNLFIFLWSLLLIVPGIVKAYEYRMVPYLLADDPRLTYKAAFAVSKEMMEGQKMNAFVLDLSFIGWRFLGALLFGLGGIFFAEPYYDATCAELYNTLKAEYINRRAASTVS